MHPGSGSNGCNKGSLTDVLSITNISGIFSVADIQHYYILEVEYAHVCVATAQSSTAPTHLSAS